MQQSHEGHRERMRERLRKSGSLDGFAEHEILEMLLFYVYPRGNTNQLAHELIERFGSLKGVMNASKDELMQVRSVGESCALAIGFFNMLCGYVRRQELGGIDVRDYGKMLEYIPTFFTEEKNEKFKIFCVNSSCRIQSVSDVSSGTENSVPVNFKELTRTVLNSGCRIVVLAHNHPGAPNTPSQEDIAVTREIINYLKMLDITVLDHYVVGINGIMSMRSCGMIHGEE
ncbi:MAG: RadC family protein [Ruminococcus sp.]|nr:RadC family protein [Ruminococcus sp.]